MNQYQVKYISRKDQLITEYLHGNSISDIEIKSEKIQGIKQLVSIRLWHPQKEMEAQHE